MPHFDAAIKPLIRQPFCYKSYRLFCTNGTKKIRNYYDILGVKPNASMAEIKSAFYKLSKKYHPDVSKNSSESHMNAAMYLQIRDAYEVLKDKKKRQNYDLGLSDTTSTPHPSSYRQHGTSYNHYGQKYYDSGNFYARTSNQEEDRWYEWYKKHTEQQRMGSGNRRNDDEKWIKSLLAFFLIFFVLSMIARIQAEHTRRKLWIEHMRQHNYAQKMDKNSKEWERLQEIIRNSQNGNGIADSVSRADPEKIASPATKTDEQLSASHLSLSKD